MSAIRPLPARPNLEFEHKQAKARLRELRATQPDAKLADVQLAIAREYGFANWPKLVRYFEDVQRQVDQYKMPNQPQHYEFVARHLPAQLRGRLRTAGNAFAAYVPRFYGLPVEEIYHADVTEDEARLVAARMNGFASWQAMLDSAEAFRLLRASRKPATRISPMSITIAEDAGSLNTIVAKYPDQLSEFLCGGFRMKPHVVRFLLDKGADPNWVTPGGIPVLEIALLRYWDGEAVDVLAARTKPRKALWIAAGLGDVAGVRSFLDRDGKPTKEARELRPDMVAAGFSGAAHPDPTDEEVLMEAFLAAMFNGRTKVIEFMVSRGFDVDTRVWDEPAIKVAVGNGWLSVVECLLRCGANPEPARDVAREIYEHQSHDKDRRRIVELFGMDPKAILAEREARPAPEPQMSPDLLEVMALAGDDAARQGLTEIGPENLFWGMMRNRDGMAEQIFTRGAQALRYDPFWRDHADRLLPAENRIQRSALNMNAEAQAVMRTVIELARKRRREVLHSGHLLHVMMSQEPSMALDLLRRYGGNEASVMNHLETTL